MLPPLRYVAVALCLVLSGASSAAASLRVERIVIDTRTTPRVLSVQIASTPASQAQGLMGRKHLALNAGMLFDFHKSMMVAFWMKDTPLSLDILFVRADGTASSIASNAVPFSEHEIVSSEPIRAVIEIRGGRAHALGIEPGDVVHARAFGNEIRH